MTTLYLASRQGLAALRAHNGAWKAELVVDAAQVPAVAVDPGAPERVYAGTFEGAVFRSEDAGRSWQPCGQGIGQPLIWSIAVSPTERRQGAGVVYVGTEMSALYRSEDGGRTWAERRSLQDVPSRPAWSFPPKPDTHHVRCIALDPVQEGLVHLGIEQGGVLRSTDAGETWADHNQQAQIDPHTMRTHKEAPGRIYEAAGGGYAESHDFGLSWVARDGGMSHHYCYGLAVDSGDPDTMVISAAPDYIKAHNPRDCWSTIYRSTGSGEWTEVRDGLPGPEGIQTQLLGADPAEAHVFYMSTTEADLYGSTDGGAHWERLAVDWGGLQLNGVRAVVASSE